MQLKWGFMSGGAFWSVSLWVILQAEFLPFISAAPVNVIVRPGSGTHVQVGPMNAIVQPGYSIFRPLGILVDVPTILYLRVVSHPLGGTGVNINLPILDKMRSYAKLPAALDDSVDGESVDGTAEMNTKKDVPVTNSIDISVGKHDTNEVVIHQDTNITTVIQRKIERRDLSKV
ncbi:uncharacterized protein LOC111268383 isoform X1 [Varroa jacobsoni]|uniref:uncharacterized protein LOC111268383 isoform X1 n=2 Tax=Varroa jacobsoni TaxID=62625 RepID=UPI000BF6CDB9|nr:uncharacterized protein LOC111268383 isoform X1 [Varroa jacobsoni]